MCLVSGNCIDPASHLHELNEAFVMRFVGPQIAGKCFNWSAFIQRAQELRLPVAIAILATSIMVFGVSVCEGSLNLRFSFCIPR